MHNLFIEAAAMPDLFAGPFRSSYPHRVDFRAIDIRALIIFGGRYYHPGCGTTLPTILPIPYASRKYLFCYGSF